MPRDDKSEMKPMVVLQVGDPGATTEPKEIHTLEDGTRWLWESGKKINAEKQALVPKDSK